MSIVVAAISLAVSAASALSAAVLAWRRDRRNQSTGILDQRRAELEIQLLEKQVQNADVESEDVSKSSQNDTDHE